MDYGGGRHSRYNGFLELIGAFSLAGLLVFAVPGLLLVFTLDRLLALSLERDQLVTFGLSASVALCATSVVHAGGFWRGTGHYLATSLFVAWLLAVAAWGFHAQWPRTFVASIWGSSLGAS